MYKLENEKYFMNSDNNIYRFTIFSQDSVESKFIFMKLFL